MIAIGRRSLVSSKKDNYKNIILTFGSLYHVQSQGSVETLTQNQNFLISA